MRLQDTYLMTRHVADIDGVLLLILGETGRRLEHVSLLLHPGLAGRAEDHAAYRQRHQHAQTCCDRSCHDRPLVSRTPRGPPPARKEPADVAESVRCTTRSPETPDDRVGTGVSRRL